MVVSLQKTSVQVRLLLIKAVLSMIFQISEDFFMIM